VAPMGGKVTPLAEAAGLQEYWSQKILAEANGQLFKVAKGVGSTNWHKHDDQDEAFFVLQGRLTIDLRDGPVVLDAGDFYVVPRGVEHRPKAEDDVLLFFVGTSVTSTRDGGKPDWSVKAPPAS